MTGILRAFCGFLMRLGTCLILGITCAAADDRHMEVGADLTVSSDYRFRGISQTLGKPAMQASIDAEFQSGFYTYVWASNVDFVPKGNPDDGANLEIDLALGYAAELNDTWSVDAVLVRYLYPGTFDTAAYDYNELITTLSFKDRYAATVGYSDDVFGMHARGLFYSLSAHYELPAELSLALEAGHYDLDDAFGASYSHIGIGLSRSFGDIEFTLAYQDTLGDAQQIYYAESIGSSIVLSVDIGLFR